MSILRDRNNLFCKICHFLPIVTTIALFIGFYEHTPIIIASIIPVMIIAGWVAALLTGPIRFFKPSIIAFGKGWNIGQIFGFVPLGDCVAGLLFGCWGLCFVLAFSIICPGVITIYYYFWG